MIDYRALRRAGRDRLRGEHGRWRHPTPYFLTGRLLTTLFVSTSTRVRFAGLSATSLAFTAAVMAAASMLSPAVLPVIDWQATTDSITSSTATIRDPRAMGASPASVTVGGLCPTSQNPVQPRLARHAAW